MKRIKEILTKVNNLTYHQLYKMIDELGLDNVPVYKFKSDLHNGQKRKIYRARPTGILPFNNVKQLSYNPRPSKIDRASTPCTPMFYGAISMHRNDYPMVTNTQELIEVLRAQSYDEHEQEIAIGEFELIRDVNVGAIIFHKEFLIKNPQFKELYKDFKKMITSDFEIMEDFSTMFSLKEGDANFNHLVTAAFTNYIFECSDTEAIIYPSVRLDGEGTNIAFHPDAADEYLVCKRARVVKVYMKGGCVIFDYLKESKTIKHDGTIEWKDYPNTLGANVCKNKLEEIISDRKMACANK